MASPTANEGSDGEGHSSGRREVVILVHGTAAGDTDPNTPKWWEPTSAFATDLRGRLGPSFEVGYTADSAPFKWSGDNSERGRIEAGKQLLARLRQHDTDGVAYHLVGHSHGGSVIWHALQRAAAVRRPLAGLRSWSTVGTPFLEFRPVWVGGLMLIAWAFATILFLIPLAVLPNGSFKEFYRINRDSATMPDLMLSALPWLALLALALSLAYYSVNWLFERFRLRWRQSCERAAAASYGRRWLGLWHADDEPLGGLKASLITPLQFMPRLTNRRSGKIWRVLVMPINQVVGRLVNRVVAPVVDEFVWVLSMGKLQGSDMIARTMVHAGPAPGALRPGWPALPHDLDAAMTTQAGSRAANSVAKMRHELALLGDRPISEDAIQHFASSISWTEILHNGYFDHASARELISAHVLRFALAPPTPPPPVCQEVADFLAAEPPMEDAPRAKTWSERWASPSRLFMPWRLATASVLSVCAVAAGLYGATVLAYSKLIEPLTRDWQVSQLVAKASSRELLTGKAVEQAAELSVRLEALGKFDDAIFSRIGNLETRSLVAQRLAYAQAHTGKIQLSARPSGPLIQMATAVPAPAPLDKLLEQVETVAGKAAVVAQVLAGGVAAGTVRPPLGNNARKYTDFLIALKDETIAPETKLLIWGVAIPPLEKIKEPLQGQLLDFASAAAAEIARTPTKEGCADVLLFAYRIGRPYPDALVPSVSTCQGPVPPRPVAPKPVPTVKPRLPEPPQSVELARLMSSPATYAAAAELIAMHMPAPTAAVDAYEVLAPVPQKLLDYGRTLQAAKPELAGRMLDYFLGPKLPGIIEDLFDKGAAQPFDKGPKAVFAMIESASALAIALKRGEQVSQQAASLAEAWRDVSLLSVEQRRLLGMRASAAAYLYRAVGRDDVARQQADLVLLWMEQRAIPQRFDTAMGVARLARPFDVPLMHRGLNAAHDRVFVETALGSIETAKIRLREIGRLYLDAGEVRNAQRSFEFAADLSPRENNAPYGPVLHEYRLILDRVISDFHPDRGKAVGIPERDDWPDLINVYPK